MPSIVRHFGRSCWSYTPPFFNRCLMKLFSQWRPLPHEIFFGLFLAITWLRLGVCAGFLGGDALFYLALIILNVAAIWFCHSRESAVRWRVGLLFYPLALNIVFPQM